MIQQPILSAHHLNKEVTVDQRKFQILKAINLSVHSGEFVSIVGPSGSGKTSLLHCLSGLTPVSEGEVYLKGKNMTKMRPNQLAHLRKTEIAFIFQEYNLIESLNIYDNITLPLRLAKKKIHKREVDRLLDDLHFGVNPNASIHALSGGEQQKVAIARALISQAAIIFADEPTGATDSKSTAILYQILRSLTKSGRTIVMVTHDLNLAAQTDRTLVLKDGRIIDECVQPDALTLSQYFD